MLMSPIGDVLKIAAGIVLAFLVLAALVSLVGCEIEQGRREQTFPAINNR